MYQLSFNKAVELVLLCPSPRRTDISVTLLTSSSLKRLYKPKLSGNLMIRVAKGFGNDKEGALELFRRHRRPDLIELKCCVFGRKDTDVEHLKEVPLVDVREKNVYMYCLKFNQNGLPLFNYEGRVNDRSIETVRQNTRLSHAVDVSENTRFLSTFGLQLDRTVPIFQCTYVL